MLIRYGILKPLLALILLLSVTHRGGAEESLPLASFGAGLSGGIYSARTNSANSTWKAGPGYGGGLVFEKMWNSRFGIHSGFWYHIISMKMVESNEGKESQEMKLKSDIFQMPLCLLVAFRAGSFSLNPLAGFSVIYVRKTVLENDTNEGTFSANVSRYMAKSQLGMLAGLEFKYALGRFTDLFLITEGEYCFTKLIRADSDKKDFLYSGRLLAGVMLRTFR